MMIRAYAYAGLLALLSGTASGQTPSPAFDVADVHVSPHSINPVMHGGFMRGGRYELRTATMLDLIQTAYGVDAINVTGGPSWLEADRFDVIAKAPAGSTPENLKLMLQALLAERFKLVVHNDNKSLSGYALTMVKRNAQMKASGGTGGSGCQGKPPSAPAVNQSYACHNMTMAAFTEMLRGSARGYVGTDPVQDKTGLKGAWDFTIEWSARNILAAGGSDAVSLFDAIAKQLGMKLDQTKIPVPVIVVDSVNRKPADNPPGVTQKIPVVPTEFEVADIKPSLPGAEENVQIQPGGRIDARGISLKDLIKYAWNIDDNNDDMIDGPKWLEGEHFDVIAKAPGAEQMDDETLGLMLRTLLVDRFKLATHFEDRPVTVWALVAVKPKLKSADPANRSACKVAGVGSNGGASAARLRTFTCQNMTMSLFADSLHGVASGYIDHPVVDKTELEGAFDFTLGFSGRAVFEGRVGGKSGDGAGSAGAASDPNGAVSLYEALEKQLGLKLEVQKSPMPMLVVDHIEPKPTDN